MKKWIQRRAANYKRSTNDMQSFYNRICVVYGFVERNLNPKIDGVVAFLQKQLHFDQTSTAVEFACGSGLLTQKLSPLFKSISARDISSKMLERAKGKLSPDYQNITFEQGNILEIKIPNDSFDYAFISFGLHLFTAEEQKQIIKQLLLISRKQIVIIDHPPKWELFLAVVEWFEGSHYDDFINMNWRSVAKELDASFSRQVVNGCQVQIWEKQKLSAT